MGNSQRLLNLIEWMRDAYAILKEDTGQGSFTALQYKSLINNWYQGKRPYTVQEIREAVAMMRGWGEHPPHNDHGQPTYGPKQKK